MPAIQQLLHHAQQILKNFDGPKLEAEILLAHVLKKPRAYLYAWPDEIISQEVANQFIVNIHERLNGKPMAYITGVREFWSLQLAVNQHTLIPRQETELLIATLLALYPDQGSKLNVADLGTGSGAIALSLACERPNWEIDATDIHAAALQIAKHNAETHQLKNIYFHVGDWYAALPKKKYDIIVSNPPYIAETEWQDYQSGLLFEPKTALVSGQDGLAAIRKIIQSAKDYLVPQGLLLLEHGFKQGGPVREIFAEFGFENSETKPDLSGLERITLAKFNH